MCAETILPGSSHRRDGAVYEIARVFLESHGDCAEGDRLGPEDVREAKPHLLPQRSGVTMEWKVWSAAPAHTSDRSDCHRSVQTFE